MRGLFVTGTGTEVGKTVVAAAIARTVSQQGGRVAVFKPAVSGLDEGGEPDYELLRRAARSKQSDDQISPYRFGPAVSPHLGAALTGKEISAERLLQSALAALWGSEFLVCEGTGGFLVPLTRDYLVRDLARQLGLPVVIAASPALGTINHTLLTLESVRASGLKPAAVVLTPWPADPTPVELSNLETIARLGGVAVEVIPNLDLERPQDWPPLEIGAQRFRPADGPEGAQLAA